MIIHCNPNPTHQHDTNNIRRSQTILQRLLEIAGDLWRSLDIPEIVYNQSKIHEKKSKKPLISHAMGEGCRRGGGSGLQDWRAATLTMAAAAEQQATSCLIFLKL
ncbi:hypothetical protein AAMO2058_001543700 [Amorphochlora amoebiformis]